MSRRLLMILFRRAEQRLQNCGNDGGAAKWVREYTDAANVLGPVMDAQSMVPRAVFTLNHDKLTITNYDKLTITSTTQLKKFRLQ